MLFLASLSRCTDAVFAFPLQVWLWVGLLASKPTGDVREAEERLSLDNSCGSDVYRLPQRC